MPVPLPGVGRRLTTPLRRTVAASLETLLGEPFVAARAGDARLPPQAVSRRIHREIVPMLAGGVAALLLQMLHPTVLAGVWDHSDFRADMRGRLRRTARFVSETTYGTPEQADRAIAAVRTIHRSITGIDPDGRSYVADDPDLLDWVHLSGATSFLAAWRRYAEPRMTGADQDRYLAEMAEIARALGASRAPRNRREAERLTADYRALLRCDERTRAVAALVLEPPGAGAAVLPMLVARAGVDLLPGWAQAVHGRTPSLVERAAVRAAIGGIAAVLRRSGRAEADTRPGE